MDANARFWRPPQKFVADAKQKNETLQVTPDQLDLKDGSVFVKADPSKKLALQAVAQSVGMPILGRAIYRQDNDWERTAWAAHAAEVEIDTGTGSVTVTKIVAAHDVGRAINRSPWSSRSAAVSSWRLAPSSPRSCFRTPPRACRSTRTCWTTAH